MIFNAIQMICIKVFFCRRSCFSKVPVKANVDLFDSTFKQLENSCILSLQPSFLHGRTRTTNNILQYISYLKKSKSLGYYAKLNWISSIYFHFVNATANVIWRNFRCVQVNKQFVVDVYVTVQIGTSHSTV